MSLADIKNVTPMPNTVLVHNIEQGERRTKNGIIILDDDGKERGIRERWAQVWGKHKDIDEVEVGDWILIKHGRWTRGIDIGDGNGGMVTIRKVDWPEAILVTTKQCPLET